MTQHDAWLANYRHHLEEAWCVNDECPNHQDPITVDYESEYGQGTIRPEECELCGHDLTLELPSEAL